MKLKILCSIRTKDHPSTLVCNKRDDLKNKVHMQRSTTFGL